ncbi:MAG: hypothetical protein ABL897_15210 [Hyphomicrobium sp.]
MVLARGHGLETCTQAAWIYYGPAVHTALGIPDGEMLISGMALGVPDWSVAENSLETNRVTSDEFAIIHSHDHRQRAVREQMAGCAAENHLP